MSNLMNTSEGRSALLRAACWLSARRLSRPFKRNFYRAFLDWLASGKTTFSLGTLVDGLNVLNDQERLDLLELSAFLGCGTSDSVSVADQEIWVNAITGSDTTGDGTQAAPYATFWFISLFPRIIKHSYRIIVNSDITVDRIEINAIFQDKGSLAIIGTANPVVIAGPFTIDAVSQSGGALQVEYLAPGWTDDQFYGDFAFYTTSGGPPDAIAVPVHENDTTDMWHVWDAAGGAVPAAGFQMRVIRPGVTLKCDYILLNGQAPRDIDAVNIVGSRFGIFNLNIDVGDSPYQNRVEFSGDCDFTAAFVRVIYGGTVLTYYPSLLVNCQSLNYFRFIDDVWNYWDPSVPTVYRPTNLVEGVFSGYVYDELPAGITMYDQVGLANPSTVRDVRVKQRRISAVESPSTISVSAAFPAICHIQSRRGLISIDSTLKYCGVGLLLAMGLTDFSSGVITAKFLSIDADGSVNIFDCLNISNVLFRALIGASNIFVMTETGSKLTIRDCVSDVTTSFSAYGLRIEGGPSFMTVFGDPSTLTGATGVGDIYFATSAIDAVWPGAGTGINDLIDPVTPGDPITGLGNFIVRKN